MLQPHAKIHLSSSSSSSSRPPSFDRPMAARSLNIHIPLTRPPRFCSQSAKSSRIILCSALQESTAAIVSDKKEPRAGEEAAAKVAAPLPAKEAAKEAAVKTKKAPAKALPEMMEEDIIPSLRAVLEAQDEMSQIEISFQENRLEGSFLKKDKPYTFWAFFPNGVLTGPKGFSISSYGVGPSTVEPFLIDERKITDKHVVFWIRKRLAAQGILPVWHKE